MAIKDIGKLFVKIFGSRNERIVKSFMSIAQESSQFEEQLKLLSDVQLKNKTAEFNQRFKTGQRPDDFMSEAFAVVREAARRNVNMRHFDVQLIGGNVLYQGKIAEMSTGEGKTLVATLAAYMVHITGRKVHVVTVNDYLAKRDAEWMGPIYNALGLTVGAIQADMDTTGDERRSQYGSDITYGTNNEFGFDYLRDNMKVSLEHMAQGPLEYAIIDEVDSILVDEARTPLIISGPAFDDVTRYKKADQVARRLISLQNTYDGIQKQIDTASRAIANANGEIAEAKKEKDSKRVEQAENALEKFQAELESAQAKLVSATQFYEVEYDKKAAHLTHEGITAAQEAAGVGSFFTGSNMEWPHLLEQSLRAHIVFEKEKDYVVLDGKIIIVDEFTGRLMQGRQWSDGLHQAVEAKENVTVKEETQTLATITLQNFFKLYGQISGMTGTAATEADEFMSIYKLEVVTMPTNRPCVRNDMEDVIYKSIREKFGAITDEINNISLSGRPVLVGTISIEKSEALSESLQRKYGLQHEVLNAKQHAREAVIIAQAGHQHTGRDGKIRGNVTIATNMAGRGTDIKLGEGVAEIGGLHILGTERHEARRIDNQLRGRAGRQGDKGSSQFYLCFEDDLMRIFAAEWTVKALSRVGWQEGEPIYHPWISRGIEKAQKKVEERNFDIRKSLLEYDEVMDYQRKIFYSRRRKVLEGRGLKSVIDETIESAINKACEKIIDKNYAVKCIIEWAKTAFNIEIDESAIAGNEVVGEIEDYVKQKSKDSVSNEISLSIGEYLEDYDNPQTWDTAGLSKWAMSAFKVNLSPTKIKSLKVEEIERELIDAACEQVDKKDCSMLSSFMREDFALKMLKDWANLKFDLNLDLSNMESLNAAQIKNFILDKTKEKYKRREIEYPVEFALNMVYGPQGPNVYAYEMLTKWAKRKYNADFSIEQIQNAPPRALHRQLLELSEGYNNGRLESEIEQKISSLDSSGFISWANERFDANLPLEEIAEKTELKAAVLQRAREFLRSELGDLEKYVLLQVFDSSWKDHLRNMDHLKDSIWMRSFAEKDPKIEYKREGFRTFEAMLQSIEDRVTDIIFKVRLESGLRAKSVWNVSRTSHDEVSQFSAAEQQRAAAQAPQGEVKVKQIKLDQPKVGRNDDCPCGSGKKYKKCCGKNA